MAQTWKVILTIFKGVETLLPLIRYNVAVDLIPYTFGNIFWYSHSRFDGNLIRVARVIKMIIYIDDA
jgi:hypothetical protein